MSRGSSSSPSRWRSPRGDGKGKVRVITVTCHHPRKRMIQYSPRAKRLLDASTEPVIGPATSGRTRWRSMTRNLPRGERALFERQAELLPYVDEGFGKIVDQTVVVIRARRQPQALGAFRHRRIIDRLDVDAVLGEEKIACFLAALGIADEDRHDMRGARHYRQRRRREHRFGAGGTILMAIAFPLRGLQMPDRGGWRRAHRR